MIAGCEGVKDVLDDARWLVSYLSVRDMDHEPSSSLQFVSSIEFSLPRDAAAMPAVAIRFDRNPLLRKREVEPGDYFSIVPDLELPHRRGEAIGS